MKVLLFFRESRGVGTRCGPEWRPWARARDPWRQWPAVNTMNILRRPNPGGEVARAARGHGLSPWGEAGRGRPSGLGRGPVPPLPPPNQGAKGANLGAGAGGREGRGGEGPAWARPAQRVRMKHLSSSSLKAAEAKMNDGDKNNHKRLRVEVKTLTEELGRLRSGEAPEQTAPQAAGTDTPFHARAQAASMCPSFRTVGRSSIRQSKIKSRERRPVRSVWRRSGRNTLRCARPPGNARGKD